MVEQDDSKRERSPRFPFINLEKAIERAQQYYENEKRGSAVVGVAGKHWGYAAKSSGLMQTIAALKSYGLLEDEGSGTDRKVRLSDLALRILLDQRPNSQERQTYIRSAALNPGIARVIYDSSPENPPSPANLEHKLIFDYKFNQEAAKSAVDIYFNNQAFAKLYSSVDETQNKDSDKELMKEWQGEYKQPISVDVSTNPIAKTEKIIGPDGLIVVQFSQEPSWNSYDFLEQYIQLRKRVLKKED